MDYESILDRTRIFNDKNLLELSKEEVERYLLFLGYTKTYELYQKSSKISERSNEVKNIIFFVLCKLLQDYSEYLTSNKHQKNDKEDLKKELKSYHYDLFKCLIENVEKRTKLSVYNPVFLKLIQFNIKERKQNLNENDFESVEEKVESILYLTSELYFNYGSEIHNKNKLILFSSNELGELTNLVLADISIFRDFLNSFSNCNGSDPKVRGKICLHILKRIRVLLAVIRFSKRTINTKFLEQLLVFIYNLDQFKEKSKVNGSEGCIENGTNGVVEIEEYIFEIIKGSVKDNVVQLMNNFSNEENDEEKETGKKEKTYGLFLLLPKIVENIQENQETVKTICTKLRSSVSEWTEKDGKTNKSEGPLIAIKSYYNILVAVRDKTFLLSVISESMEFIFRQLFHYYETIGTAKGNHKDRKNKQNKPFRQELDFYWKVLTVVSNVKLELLDENIEKVFELLKKDFQIFSTNISEKKTMSLLQDISLNHKRNQTDDSELERFLKNLLLQYNSLSQLSSVFKYIHFISKGKQDEAGEDIESGDERVQKRKLISEDALKSNSKKKLKISEGDSSSVKNDTNEKSDNQKPIEINHLNNCSILSAINQLEVNSSEIMYNLKIMEEFDVGLYTIVVAYLSRLKFSALNVTKVAKQFVSFCSKISVSDDVVGLSLLLQLVVVSRKLLSLLSPQVDPEEDLEDSEDKTLKNEQDLIKSLLFVVYNVYVYVEENFNAEENEMILLNILYNIMLVNNDKFRVSAHFYTKNDKEQELKETEGRLFKMEVDHLLMKLLDKCTSKEVVGFILARIKLFYSRNLSEKLCNLCSPELSEYYANLNKDVSMYCFRKLITDKKINNEKLKNAGALLENIVGVDNEEVINILLSNINAKFRKLASPSPLFVERITILLELLLFVLNYELLINVSKSCKAVVCNLKNVFDIIVWLKTVADSGNRRKIVKMFSKYYSVFTEYIYKYTRIGNGSKNKEKDDKGFKETCLLTSNLLSNYLKKQKSESKAINESSESGNEGEEYWNAYFLYQYIKCLKVKNFDTYTNLSLSTILESTIVSYFNSRNTYDVSDKKLNKMEVKQENIDLMYNSVKLIDNKYVSNLILYYLNSRNFEFKADRNGDKLYKLMLSVIGALNISSLLSVPKKIGELNRFLKNNPDINNQIFLITLDNLIGRCGNSAIFQTKEYANELILLLALINVGRDQNLELVEKTQRLLDKLQDYIDKSVDEGFSKSVEDILILNYLIVYKLNQKFVTDKVKDKVPRLVQIILKVVSRVKERGERRDYCNMLMKLVNVLTGNVIRNINLLIYFYYQFNYYVVNSYSGDDLKTLIRFTNSIINFNTIKFIKSYVPMVLTMAVNTLYQLEASSEKRVLNPREMKMLRKCIVKHVKTTGNKGRIYKLLKNEIKPFFKELVAK